MTTSAKRQRRIAVNRAKVDSCDREAINRALGMLMREERIVRRLKALGGALRGDKRTWPYS